MAGLDQKLLRYLPSSLPIELIIYVRPFEHITLLIAGFSLTGWWLIWYKYDCWSLWLFSRPAGEIFVVNSKSSLFD